MSIGRILFFVVVAALGLGVVYYGRTRTVDPGKQALVLAQAISSTTSTDKTSDTCHPTLFANARAEDVVLCFKLADSLETAKQKVEAAALSQNNLTTNPWTDDEKLHGSGTILATARGDLWFAVTLLEPQEQLGTTYGRMVFHTGH